MVRQRRKHHFWRNLIILIVLFGIYLCWGNSSIETDEVTFPSGTLPAGFDGCRIVHLSDLHGKYFGKDNERLYAAVRAAQPEYIFVTGDLVVVIIILAAAALAMVVLFNLSNINITERQRELATIKLLGFYDKEVSAYVYRENIVLTVFGILMGCFMGHWLHIYLVRSTEIDLMMFGRQTAPSAYVYAAILTMLFSVLVNVLAHFKMKKIDMVESLKSAE